MFGCALLCRHSASEILAATETAENEAANPAIIGTADSIADERSVLTEARGSTVLITVLDVITGQIYNGQFFTMHRFTDTIVPTSTGYILQTEKDSYESKMYDCPVSAPVVCDRSGRAKT